MSFSLFGKEGDSFCDISASSPVTQSFALELVEDIAQFCEDTALCDKWVSSLAKEWKRFALCENFATNAFLSPIIASLRTHFKAAQLPTQIIPSRPFG